jgi:phosphohistidine phosphatase
MKIYIMRHADAVDGERMDTERTLTDLGRWQAKVMAKATKQIGVKFDLILSSAFKRGVDTAEYFIRKRSTHVILKQLEPDGSAERAWTAILKAIDKAKDPEHVLVIGHGPQIHALITCACFAFEPGEKILSHGNMVKIESGDGAHSFHWLLSPTLAAHFLGKTGKKDPEGNRIEEAIGRGCLAVAENLMRSHKAAVIDPLVSKMRSALRGRWRRQLKRLLATLEDLKPAIEANDVVHVTSMLDAALPANDPKFAKTYDKVRDAAYAHGATHVNAQLAKLSEATPKRPLLPGSYELKDDVSDYETGLDITTSERVKTSIAGVGPLTLLAVAAALRTTLNGFSQVEAGQVSRGETAALNVVSDAYHQGGADVASFVADSTGGEVEKHWDAEDDACEICIENEDEGWIPEDAPHSSGDFEPQAHPNCRCSESYRVATAE